MKLYHNGQQQGWQLPGKQDKRAQRVDVPSSPPELVDWLNYRDVGPTGAAAERERQLQLSGQPSADEPEQIEQRAKPPVEMIPGHCPACGRSAAGSLKLALGNDLDAFSDWLESRTFDDVWALQRAAELIRDRSRALGAAADRIDQGGEA